MLFNSVDFLIFFPIVVLLYFIIPQKVRWIWLLVASYYFYMNWNAAYAILIFISTFVTWLSGLLLDKEDKSEKFKKAVVTASLVINLGILAFFKYALFAIGTVNAVLGKTGISFVVPTFDIILPVGISFYTFQALSYTMDVYRKEIKAEKNLFRYALFVSFFPQLVAGPIERSKNLLGQLQKPTKLEYDNFRRGLLYMGYGYFIKVVIADNVAVIVNGVYANPVSYPGVYLIVATVLFAIQIYGDFAGYSMISIGAARVLGFNLLENFNAPYMATSVADFWRRWHISLTSWFRDYLYIPLGGNRKGTLRKYINVMIVFLVSGLWHGASWHYVVWGGLNGLFQVVGSITSSVREKWNLLIGTKTDTMSYKLLRGILTFILVDFTWLFFRAESCGKAFVIIKSILTQSQNIWILFDGSLYNFGIGEKQFAVLVLSILLLMVFDCFKNKGYDIFSALLKQQLWFRVSVYVLWICGILLFGAWGGGYDAASFIYFQF